MATLTCPSGCTICYVRPTRAGLAPFPVPATMIVWRVRIRGADHRQRRYSIFEPDGLRSGRSIIQCAVRSDAIVGLPPVLLRQRLRVQQRVGHLPVQRFIPQLPVETFRVPVLPRRPGLDVKGPGANSAEPLPDRPAVNYHPLSERMCSGTPLAVINWARVSTTSIDRMLRRAQKSDTPGCARRRWSTAAAGDPYAA